MLKVYLAGYQASSEERESFLVARGAITHRCISFANVVRIPGLPYFVDGIATGYKVCLREKVGIMMDSGVFSYRKYVKKLQGLRKQDKLAALVDENGFLRLYVDFCKQYGHLWDFCVTVDIDFDAKHNFRRHVQLEKMGVRTVPVFHGDTSLDFLKRYADRGYDYICIGSTGHLRTSVQSKKAYYESVFDAGAKMGLRYHGLGITVPYIMTDYPWYSLDSSAWSQYAGYGWLVKFEPAALRLSTVAVSRKSKSHGLGLNLKAMQRLAEELKAEGFDLKELQVDHTARHLYNALQMQKLAAVCGVNRSQWRTIV